MRLKIASILSVIMMSLCTAYAGVTVVKRAAEVNPKMYFAGIRGDSALSNYMRSNLKKCGWFDCVSSQSGSKFTISGSSSSDKVVIEVRNNLSGSGVRFALAVNSNKQILSYKLTDVILKKLFNVPGICNSKIAFDVQIGINKDIYICNFDGTGASRVTNNGTLSLNPSWGLNNQLITYTLYKSTYTDVVGKYLNSGKMYKLASFPGLNDAAAVSPNGKYIALILSKDRQVELYIKETRGNRAIRITRDRAVEGTPCWSPDGKYICYVSDRGGRPGLYVYNVKTTKTSKVNSVGSEAVSPDWSPIGNKIIYSARFGKQYTLAVYDVKNGVSSTIKINAAGDWMSPSWAPDGRHVVCSRRLNYKSQLYIVDTWTGKARKLLSYNSNLTSPSWSGLY